jgi:gliding motility-associated-like protein
MICTASTLQVSNPINFTIFNGATNQFIQNVSVNISSQYTLGKTYDEPCISGNQVACYYLIVVYDLPSIELPATPDGFTIAYQRCCRIGGINNVSASGNVGNTFAIKIPGTSAGLGFETNSSPAFLVNDTAVVCRNSYFQYSFQATDTDGDSLSYVFCDALEGGSVSNSTPPTAANPPYFSVPYSPPFAGFQPMGVGVTINPNTGLISGTAPDITGQFVLSVCVNEYRNGVLIGVTRKELHVEVGDCNPLQALLLPRPTTCDGFTVNFQNDAFGNPAGTEYSWNFGEPSSGAGNTSTIATPTHTYADTGVYTVKLRVALAGGLCADSSSFTVRVFPGFFPGFIATGSCFTNPFQFQDTTNTRYGVVDSWRWNFGDLSTLADTSRIRNPQYTYPSSGTRTVELIATNSKGCIDTAQVVVDILDKPAIAMAFTDTLICIPDAVTLNVTGTGNINWTPLVNITNPNTATPTVNPTTDTWYVAHLTNNGCQNLDSVHVRVVAGVSINAMPDTTICLTDAVRLNVTTNGLSYQWTPAATLDDPNILNPTAIPTAASTTYQIRAAIGSCFSTENITVNTVPYPVADAGLSPTICYNTSGQLNGSHNGNAFTWTPITYLDDPNVLNPIATPPRTTRYILTVFDNAGCPKPGRDTVFVVVRPRIFANAGRDTTVVIGQPLQFNGTGGVTYTWTPGTGLNNPNIFNPIGVYGPGIDSVRYKLIVRDSVGCADSAFLTVRIWKTNPSVFVPTAFTPNNDGLNDVIRPIAIGIRRINYFNIYNRWGQLLFSTTVNKFGWDGRINGRLQNAGVFVWMVSAEDYLGKPIFLKGTVTLIR